MSTEFNSYANPTIDTEHLKIYANVGSGSSEEWELQGRGIQTNEFETNADVSQEPDVLGFVDVVVSKAKPTLEMEMKLRKNSKLGAKLLDAWLDRSCAVTNQDILIKYEFIDVGASNSINCLAYREKSCTISISNLTAEAGGKITVTATLYLSNDTVKGSMAKTDGESVTFTPSED